MSSKERNLSTVPELDFSQLSEKSISIVVSEWNDDITFSLRNACLETLKKFGISEDNISVEYVPGTFELVYGSSLANQKHHPDAIVALGCVIKGETDHDKYINNAVSTGLMQLNLMLKKPVVFGVLTPNNKDQALDRAGGQYGNKGVEAAMTALKMLELKRKCSEQSQKIGF